ncbi:DUF4124 domain-containing protein [Cocleimonas sp. KMM 6892]|uniref:DUF4124 domain-containing protein n=1 Tax=unclassified Cocleimonas TaxID=2639732 RepID=UPI002DB9F30F|nr:MULTISPECIES: DUF4124 domain-containing protein [unclassified Cocleimonas]MEB8433042.1 DUF4124 domain-containing protein [Cocleimonas sp. KMM 6892]MEC4715977.1 DUF4124 domain-containing protein [Cocleimonas sp. KMM 6895]MEC4745438.1 DUF4124 domain-containing protein [Cocleimonas sp. KMM 6896]
MRFSTSLVTAFISVCVTVLSINAHADVLKWVDENGKTHYSNKEKKSSRNKAKVIKFVEYETSDDVEPDQTNAKTESGLDDNPFNEVSNAAGSSHSNSKLSSDVASYKNTESIDSLSNEDSDVHRIMLDQINKSKSYIQRKSRNTRRNTKAKPEYTIAEYNQRCEDAREELIAPLRQEAVASCMKMKHSMSSRTRDSCEEINENFGDGGMNSRGYYIQRMFHNISECQDAYDAWDRRSKKMRGYSEE